MVLEKLIYQMVTLMKENILMENDMDRLEICHCFAHQSSRGTSFIHYIKGHLKQIWDKIVREVLSRELCGIFRPF